MLEQYLANANILDGTQSPGGEEEGDDVDDFDKEVGQVVPESGASEDVSVTVKSQLREGNLAPTHSHIGLVKCVSQALSVQDEWMRAGLLRWRQASVAHRGSKTQTT